MPRKRGLSRSDFKRMDNASFHREHGALFSLSFGILSGSGAGLDRAESAIGRTDLQSDSVLGPKIACVVSKKTAVRAADRNLIKRRCRAAARACLKSASAKRLALVFYAKRAACGAPYAAVKEEIERLIGKATRGH